MQCDFTKQLWKPHCQLYLAISQQINQKIMKSANNEIYLKTFFKNILVRSITLSDRPLSQQHIGKTNFANRALQISLIAFCAIQICNNMEGHFSILQLRALHLKTKLVMLLSKFNAFSHKGVLHGWKNELSIKLGCLYSKKVTKNWNRLGKTWLGKTEKKIFHLTNR